MLRNLYAFLFCIAVLLPQGAGAQEETHNGMPADVYYLMPSFSQGMIFFKGQSPAQGKLNICALDNTLRFIDKDGSEMIAANAGNVAKVRIDTVFFIFDQGKYYRMFPVSGDFGIALNRDVQLQKDAKQGAYGTVSRTSSIQESGSMFVDGIAYNLDKVKDYPYTVTERLYLYKGDYVYVLNKKNLRKFFPSRKAEIDEYFKAGNTIPATVPELKEFLNGWKEE